MTELVAADEGPHAGSLHEEWMFDFWAPDGSVGGVMGYRLVGRSDAWYWWALARAGEPVLHVTEWTIPRRADPMIAKAQAMWAEHVCEAPFEQWTLGNETYAVALDDPDEGLGRAYGVAVPIASDLEWYATAPVVAIVDGYEQRGVVHGVVELSSGRLELDELPAHRTHRWSTDPLPGRRADRLRPPRPTGTVPAARRQRARSGARIGWVASAKLSASWPTNATSSRTSTPAESPPIPPSKPTSEWSSRTAPAGSAATS